MYAPELCLSVIDKVFPLSEVEIDNVDGVDFLDIAVVLPAVYILCHQFRRPEEYALEVCVF